MRRYEAGCTACGGEAHARGLCNRCYQRAVKAEGGLDDHPRIFHRAEDVVAELEHLGFRPDRPVHPQVRLLAPKLGMSEAAVIAAEHRVRTRVA